MDWKPLIPNKSIVSARQFNRLGHQTASLSKSAVIGSGAIASSAGISARPPLPSSVTDYVWLALQGSPPTPDSNGFYTAYKATPVTDTSTTALPDRKYWKVESTGTLYYVWGLNAGNGTITDDKQKRITGFKEQDENGNDIYIVRAYKGAKVEISGTATDVYFAVGEGTAENPKEILPTSLEGSETAQTDTWDVDNQDSGYDGVKIKITTRVVYNEAGDQILYGFYRELTFDSIGRLKEISAETRYNVDTPEEC